MSEEREHDRARGDRGREVEGVAAKYRGDSARAERLVDQDRTGGGARGIGDAGAGLRAAHLAELVGRADKGAGVVAMAGGGVAFSRTGI